MEQKDFHQILKKYLAGQASPEEEKMIDAWYEAMGKQAGTAMNSDGEELEKRYWKNIMSHIKKSHSTDLHKSGTGNKKLLWYFTGIAASVLIAIVSFFYLTNTASSVQRKSVLSENKTSASP